MLVLGIESTAHTFSCAIIEKKGKKGKILSDVRKIYRPEAGEGIHPREASRHHIENSSIVLSECLKESTVSVQDLDLISYAADLDWVLVYVLVLLLQDPYLHFIKFQFIL